MTGSPNQRCAAGCTAFATQESSAETIGHASVAAGATAAGPDHALELARRIAAGELTPAAVLEDCEQAIAAREAEIGAFAALDLPRAKQSAAIAPAGPLRGLPVGIKDIFDTVDFPTEYGSSIYAGHRPRTDAALVSQIRRAGGLLLGKTVTTEFAHMQPAKTRNPRNPQHTPGPAIGLIGVTAGPSRTAPDCRHSTSASCRQGSRCSNQRPHPSSATRTREPTRNRATPRAMARSMRGIALRMLQCFGGGRYAALRVPPSRPLGTTP
ncbi:MAG: hypothetical protein E6G88_03160 [Alphaproteobacteria bacterium]|nr:MAG: hypothetical protein E6G88_03160 [Alphaproteobacteria bacterium]